MDSLTLSRDSLQVEMYMTGYIIGENIE